MENLILIFICLGLGVLLQNLRTLPKDSHLVLNTLILYVVLPAVALLNVPGIIWTSSLFFLCLMPWLTFFLAWATFSALGKKLNWPLSLIGCLILTSGFGNTSFVGFPIIEALFGIEGLKFAVLVDQPGTFLIASSFGVMIASGYSSGNVDLKSLCKKILTFPFFIAFFVSIILGRLGIVPTGTARSILEKFALLLTPLALIAVGLQLKWRDMWIERKHLCVGLGFKLVLCPALIFFLYRSLNLPPLMYKVVVMESAMAPMITSSILAQTYNLQPRLASMMIGVGIPVSFITLAFWYFVI